MTARADDGPLLRPWTGPYGGLPPFGTFTVDELGAALETAMKAKLEDVERIAGDPAPPTFENTIAALERAGQALDRVGAVYAVCTSTKNDPPTQALERAMAPKLAALDDAIVQNSRLFRRIEAVHAARATSGLTAEQQRLAWLDFTSFVRAGARLDDAAKARLSAMNQRLAELFTRFSQNVLAEEETQKVVLEGEEDLAGLPPSEREAAAAAGGAPGTWAIANTRSSVDPFLTYSTRRDLREKVWRMFVSRGDHGDAHDNNAVVAEILALRAARAKLLGYPTHAHLRLDDTMARSPERAMALLEAVWKPAVARVREEVADMQAIADRDGAGVRIAPWDYLFYAEKLRKERYDLDQDAVKPYLQLDRLREAMFWVAEKLFGLAFAELAAGTVPVIHPDVRVFRVDGPGGALVGLWYFDPYARPGKHSGAWMSAYRAQSRLDGAVPTIVSNNANFVKGAPGTPVLVSWDDARTLFHEFGHALHGLSSNVTYPSLSGTNVPNDYAEFPSQLLERWLATPEVLDRFALHHATGERIPGPLVERIVASETFLQGHATVEYLASALVDMKLHLAGDRPIDPRAFEREALAELGMPAELAMRHRTPHFQHVFSGDAYSAGYYAYLWSDTLSADAFEAFTEAGGPYDPAVARRLLREVLQVGNAVDPAEGYRAFRGRDAGIDALMRRRGFPVPHA